MNAPKLWLSAGSRASRNGAQALRHALLANTVITDLNLECNMLDGKVRMEGGEVQAKLGTRETRHSKAVSAGTALIGLNL